MKKIDLAAILLIGLVALGLLTIGINKPFNGHHDDNNAYFSQVGENYLKYGVLQLKFGQLIGSSTREKPEYYTHHPQLLPISLAGAIAVFGDNFWTVRLVPILFSVATVVIFYLLLRRFFNPVSGLLSVAFLMVTPMFLYFGKMADHEAPTLFFVVLSLYFYTLWRESKKHRHFVFLLLSLFLGQWFGWPAYYLAGILFLLTRRFEILLLSLFDFGVFLLDVYLLTGSLIGGGLGEILIFRTGFGQLSWAKENYTNSQLAAQEASWLYHFLTPPQFIAAIGAFGVWLFSWIKTRKIEAKDGIWLIFLAVAALHVLLFRTGAWRHDYWLYYFLPFFAWGIASGIGLLAKIHHGKYQFPAYFFFLLLLIGAIISGQPFFRALQDMVVK